MDISPSTTPLANGWQRHAWSVALGLVLAFSAYVQFTVVNNTVVDVPLRADASVYYAHAHNLKNHGRISSQQSWQLHADSPAIAPSSRFGTPVYPAFVSLFIGPVPDAASQLAITRAQALMGILSVLLTFLVARRFVGEGGAIAAAALAAASPHLASISSYLLTESLFTLLMLSALYSACRAAESRHWRWHAGAGLLLGLAVLTRSTLLLLPGFILLLTVCYRPLRANAKNVGAGLAITAALVLGWAARDSRLPVNPGKASATVSFLLHGSYPGFMYDDIPESLGVPYRFDPDSGRIGRDMSLVLARIAENFREHPIRQLSWYLVGKPVYFLSWSVIDGVGDIYVYPVLHSPYQDDPPLMFTRGLMHVLHWPLTLLGLAGALLAIFRPAGLGLAGPPLVVARMVSLLLLYAVGLHMLGAPFPRYGIPFRPIVYMLAVMAAIAAWREYQLQAAATQDESGQQDHSPGTIDSPGKD